jgi:hypothetical protein
MLLRVRYRSYFVKNFVLPVRADFDALALANLPLQLLHCPPVYLQFSRFEQDRFRAVDCSEASFSQFRFFVE